MTFLFLKLMYLISTKQLFLLILLIPLLNSFQVPQNSQNGGPITDDFCGKFPEASKTKEVDEPMLVFNFDFRIKILNLSLKTRK